MSAVLSPGIVFNMSRSSCSAVFFENKSIHIMVPFVGYSKSI